MDHLAGSQAELTSDRIEAGPILPGHLYDSINVRFCQVHVGLLHRSIVFPSDYYVATQRPVRHQAKTGFRAVA